MCRHHAGTSQGRHGGWFCQAPRGVGCGWLKRHSDLRRQAGETTRRKASWVVPPSLRHEEMAPQSEGTVERFWSRGQTRLFARERRAGSASWSSGGEPGGRCPDTTWDARGRITSQGLSQRRHEKRACGGSASRASRDVVAPKELMARLQRRVRPAQRNRVREEDLVGSGRQRIATSTLVGPKQRELRGPGGALTRYGANAFVMP